MNQSHEICSDAHNLSARRVWDTDQVPAAEAFDLYRDGVCSAFMPLRPERPADDHHPFRSRHVAHDLGDVALNMVTASPHPVFKDAHEIAASSSECFYVNLQLAGRCRITQSDETVEIRSGQIAMFDSTRPFALDHGQNETLQVVSFMVPKTLLPNKPAATPQVLTDHPIYGAALGHSAAAIVPALRGGGHDAALRLRDVVLGLTDLALSDGPSNHTPQTRRAAQYYRIVGLTRQHCRDHSVTIEQIASMVGLSVGAVRNIFTAHEDTFGRRVLKERIEVAKSVLRNPSNAHMTVAEIAFCSGFSDAAHFGRAFKDATGLSPGAWRNSVEKFAP